MYLIEVLSENRNLKTVRKEAETVITDINIESLPSYGLGMEKGIEKGMEKGMENGVQQIVKQLLMKNSPEIVAELTNLSLANIMAIKNKENH